MLSFQGFDVRLEQVDFLVGFQFWREPHQVAHGIPHELKASVLTLPVPAGLYLRGPHFVSQVSCFDKANSCYYTVVYQRCVVKDAERTKQIVRSSSLGKRADNGNLVASFAFALAY